MSAVRAVCVAVCLVVLLAGLSAPAEGAGHNTPRVRKELREMTAVEFTSLVQALGTMQMVPTEVGQALYGAKYSSYQDMINKHAVATQDPRGDQGHNGPCFMTFHRAFLLQLEDSLLSVAPNMKAIPYIDITKDVEGGEFYGTESWAFAPHYVGSIDCGRSGELLNLSAAAAMAENGCQVTDGVLGNRVIEEFDGMRYIDTYDIFNGSNITGLTRAFDNANTNPRLSRFPVINNWHFWLNTPDWPAINIFIPQVKKWVDDLTGMGAGTSWNYTQADFERCLDPEAYSTWMEWNFCADFTTWLFPALQSAMLGPAQPAGAFPPIFDPYWLKFLDNMSPSLHANVHWIVGGIADDNSTMGDMTDVATSPSEALMFMMHHANIDRSAMHWQRAALRRNATMSDTDVLWDFPKSLEEYPPPYGWEGCFVNDTINSAAPFMGLFNDVPGAATHGDVIVHTGPGNDIYTYDSLVSECLCVCPSG